MVQNTIMSKNGAKHHDGASLAPSSSYQCPFTMLLQTPSPSPLNIEY